MSKINNLDTKAEWQDWFDQTFPAGISVYQDLSDLHFFVSHVEVTEVESSEPTIRFYPSHIPNKVMGFRVEGIETEGEKQFSVTTDEGQANWTFSTNISPETAKALKEEKDHATALRTKYADPN